MVERISPKEVYEKMERGEGVLLLDVRVASWYRSDVKAQGAYRIPPEEVETRYNELPKGKLIVAYCT